MRTTRILAVTIAVLLVAGLPLPGCASNAPSVRPAAVAGSFYPADAKKLEAAVKAFLADAIPPRGERPIAIVAPHAGYVFSGQIAADAWRQAMGYPVDVIVILGTNHTAAPFDGVSIFQRDGYQTPLGVAKIDRNVADALVAADRAFAYRPDAHVKEHSEEVQIPFAQAVFPQAKIVTAIVGTQDLAMTERFGKALAKALDGKRALIVASSDLSHYPSYDDAVATDRATLKAFAAMDAAAIAGSANAQMKAGRASLVTCACGEGPVLAAIAAARALGAKRGVVVSYANSGDTLAGDRDRVVGYGAVMFTAGAGGTDTKALERLPAAGKTAPLGEKERQSLLHLARTTLERWYATDTLPLPRSGSPELQRKQGAFVTLNKRGELRGCIGQMTEDTPLEVTVGKMALSAAMEDPRFDPVRAAELRSIDIEVSVLTPKSRVSGPEAIRVGTDGVVIVKDGRSAVFLPQVAPEQRWNRDQMLGHLCEKAGMDGGCWRSGAAFYTFQADVFGEKRVSGE